jgi:hypothetical protein
MFKQKLQTFKSPLKFIVSIFQQNEPTADSNLLAISTNFNHAQSYQIKRNFSVVTAGEKLILQARRKFLHHAAKDDARHISLLRKLLVLMSVLISFEESSRVLNTFPPSSSSFLDGVAMMMIKMSLLL